MIGSFSLLFSVLVAFGSSTGYKVVEVGPGYAAPYSLPFAVGDFYGYVGSGVDGNGTPFDDFGALRVFGNEAFITLGGWGTMGSYNPDCAWDGGVFEDVDNGWFRLARWYDRGITGHVSLNGEDATNVVVSLFRDYGSYCVPVDSGMVYRTSQDGAYWIHDLEAGNYRVSAWVSSGSVSIEYPYSNVVTVADCLTTGINFSVVQPVYPAGVFYRVDEVGPGWAAPYSLPFSVGEVYSYVGSGFDGNGTPFEDFGALRIFGNEAFITKGGYGTMGSYTPSVPLWNGGVFEDIDNGWFRVVRGSVPGISGRVTVNGAAASNAVVLVWREVGSAWVPVGEGDTFLTGSNGLYSVSGLTAGNYHVAVGVVSGGCYLEYPLTNIVTVSDSLVSGVDLSTVRNCSLTGSVKPFQNVSRAGLLVSVWKRSSSMVWISQPQLPGYIQGSMDPMAVQFVPPVLFEDGAWYWSITGNKSVMTDSNGVFSVADLDIGDYMIEINDPVSNFVSSVFSVRIDRQLNSSFYLPVVAGAWLIPVGEIWITSIKVQGASVVLTVANCDPTKCYFIFGAPSVAGLASGSESRSVCGYIEFLSGEVSVTLPFDGVNRFFKITSPPPV
jgi:hypothetical protein